MVKNWAKQTIRTFWGIHYVFHQVSLPPNARCVWENEKSSKQKIEKGSGGADGGRSVKRISKIAHHHNLEKDKK
jgi:hypothetical protein